MPAPGPASRVARWAVATMLVVVALPACTSDSAHTTRAPTLDDVGKLLARHGTAVLDRSSKQFLADVDSDASAAPFRAQQVAQIAALSTVPFRAWTYSIDAPSTDASAVAASTKRLGAPTLIVHISLSYRLDIGDAEPSVHDLWWTFVRRGSRVVAAADDDLAQSGGVSWQGPWDFGPIVVKRSASALVLGHPESASELPAILQAADAAITKVDTVLATNWLRQVVVVVPSSDAELGSLGASPTTVADISAEAVFDPAPGANGAPTGARILLVPSVWSTLTPLGRAIALRHEITHIATAGETTTSSPRWLVEGLAEYVANQGTGQTTAQIASELRKQVMANELPVALPDIGAFRGTAASSASAYEQAWLACRLIAARAGRDGLLRFYRVVGATVAPGDKPLIAGLQTVLHESLASFVAQWRRYLRAELR